ncbi:cation channel sperm-associated protein subunit beta-like [Electrophorus electricus]|uniref:cation channel sperm-associated protein subunit beta-like n=1 Tax=Electrophorus electricus TaxID=8005 RepID=UPI0015D0459E|nr:cation channel sperm-associated protein subunit beta-like [Electrophorus electricus]
MVTDALCCTLTGVVVFLTNKGHIYLMKTGLDRFTWLNETLKRQSFLLCDHMGILLVVSLDPEAPITFSYKTINISRLIEGYEMGFNSALAVQYTTQQSVILHEFDHLKAPQNTSVTAQPSHFSSSHVGKVVYFRAGGEVLITEVFQTPFLRSFSSVALGEILKPVRGVDIMSEPMQSNDLLVLRKDPQILNVSLQLDGTAPAQGFDLAHLGRTVVASRFSSYLIRGIVDPGEAVAVATLPALIPASITHKEGDWLLVSSKGENAWGMREGPCHHILQSMSGLRRNAMIHVGVLAKVNYTFKAIKTDRSFPTVHKKLMKVVQTNPFAMQVTLKHSWDISDNHVVTISVYNHLCRKAMTIVTVFIPEASLLCSSSSFSFTLQNSGPEGVSIVYLPLDPISDHDWLHSDPLDHMGNKRLFNLSVNYMPPAQLGMLIPSSANIYNADPSKPRPLQHYPISKNSGHYKQCAGKKSAKECGCTDALRLSSLAVNSDCRQRVLRVMVPVIKITLYLRQAYQPDQPLRSPFFVTVTEINNRTNWNVIGTLLTLSKDRMRQHPKKRLSQTFYNPEGLEISCYGSELFHFQISVISGVVPCDLMEEIQIYVDDALAFPIQYMVSTMMAIALGSLLLCLFFLKHSGVTLQTKQNSTCFFRRQPSSVGPSV